MANNDHHSAVENILSILICKSIQSILKLGDFIMPKSRYLTAKEATDLLGVSPATLYAYVSRGLIRSEAIEGDSRVRRYHSEDVQKLKERKANRKNPAQVARSALHWGAPILESALTLIADGGLYYRGHPA